MLACNYVWLAIFVNFVLEIVIHYHHHPSIYRYAMPHCMAQSSSRIKRKRPTRATMTAFFHWLYDSSLGIPVASTSFNGCQHRPDFDPLTQHEPRKRGLELHDGMLMLPAGKQILYLNKRPHFTFIVYLLMVFYYQVLARV